MSVYVIVYVCFFFVVKKEVTKKNAEEKIKSTGKNSTAKRKWKERVSYGCVS